MDDIGDGVRMVENFNKAPFIADSKEKESVDDQIRKRLVVNCLSVMFVAK